MRRDLRETVGHAVAEGVNSDAVASLAFTTRLGSALWRAKYGGDEGSARTAVILLAKRLHLRERRRRRDFLARIAERCVFEYLDEGCSPCGGKGVVYAEAVATHACPTCAGTGRKRHGDGERAKAVGVPIDKLPMLNRIFAYAHELIANADSRAGRDVGRQMRRVAP